ncbi:MAG: ribosome maturation factor RimP [Tissierellia bacterium]|nr:ribosome maturation factor RimP [Tissierellia bacterium]
MKHNELLEIGKEVIEEKGYELVEMDNRLKKKPPRLIYYVYREGGVNIDDCAEISRGIDERLPELKDVSGSYSLEVSSPGLDRLIKTQDDYRRNRGKKVEAHVYTKVDGKKDFIGTIVDYDEDSVLLEGEDGSKTRLSSKNISAMRQWIDF